MLEYMLIGLLATGAAGSFFGGMAMVIYYAAEHEKVSLLGVLLAISSGPLLGVMASIVDHGLPVIQVSIQ